MRPPDNIKIILMYKSTTPIHDISGDDLDRLLQDVQENLPAWIDVARTKGILFGFDGFLDEIYTVVLRRHSVQDYDILQSMGDWGDIIKNSAGSAANFEIIEKKRSTGGFVANTAGSLVSLLGPPLDNVTIVGNFGSPDLLPIFSEFFAGKFGCNMVSIGNPGVTHAYEFDDGKTMMTDFASIVTLDTDAILARVPEADLLQMFDSIDLFGLGYWSITTGMTSIFQFFSSNIFSTLGKPIHLFMDLASLRKRSEPDIREAAGIIAGFPENARVTLSLNDKEAIQLYEALSEQNVTDTFAEADVSIENKDLYVFLLGALQHHLPACQLVIHSPKFAFLATPVTGNPDGSETYICPNAYTTQTSFTVAAGDAFNGGLCVGLLAGCSPEEVLLIGNATTSYFVRTGQRCDQSLILAFLGHYKEYLAEDHPEILQ
jgi:hypothetical protein